MSEAEDRILDFALRRHFRGEDGEDLSYRVLSRWHAGETGADELSLDEKRATQTRWLLPLAAIFIIGIALVFLLPRSTSLSIEDPLARAEFPIEVLRPGAWDPQPAVSFHHGDHLLIDAVEQIDLADGLADGTILEALPGTLLAMEFEDGRVRPRLLLGSLHLQHKRSTPFVISSAAGSLLINQPARLRLRISANPSMDNMNLPPFRNLARGIHLRSLAITLTLTVTVIEGSALFLQGETGRELEASDRLVHSWQHEPGVDDQRWLPSTGAAQDPMDGLIAIPQLSERLCTRMFFVYPNAEILGTSPGQFAIQYGQPAWNPAYEAQLESMPGTIMRFGKDFWSTLDSSLALTMADTSVPEGYYYIALGCEDVGEFTLNLYQPAAVRKLHLDAVQSDRLTIPAIKIPLELEELDRPAEKLSIEFKRVGESLTAAMLEITWGPFLLKAPLSTEFKKATPK